MGSFWPRYIMFELKKYRGVMFDGTEDDAKFEGKLTYAFKKHIGDKWIAQLTKRFAQVLQNRCSQPCSECAFWRLHTDWGNQKGPLPKMCHTYPTMMKLCKKVYDVIISVHDVTNKIFSRDTNCNADVVTWSKFGNSSTSMKEVTMTSILLGFDQKNHSFWGEVFVQVQ